MRDQRANISFVQLQNRTTYTDNTKSKYNYSYL